MSPFVVCSQTGTAPARERRVTADGRVPARCGYGVTEALRAAVEAGARMDA